MVDFILHKIIVPFLYGSLILMIIAGGIAIIAGALFLIYKIFAMGGVVAVIVALVAWAIGRECLE